MKKLILTTLIAAGLGMTAQGAFAAAVENTVTFTGAVKDTTCVVKSNGQTQQVPLGEVAASTLSGTGTFGPTQVFKIALTGCQSQDQARAAFNAYDADVDTGTGYIKNTAQSGGAENVQIQLLDHNDNWIDFRTANSMKTSLQSAEGNELTYKARLIATGPAGEGSVTGKITYMLAYD